MSGFVASLRDSEQASIGKHPESVETAHLLMQQVPKSKNCKACPKMYDRNDDNGNVIAQFTYGSTSSAIVTTTAAKARTAHERTKEEWEQVDSDVVKEGDGGV